MQAIDRSTILHELTGKVSDDNDGFDAEGAWRYVYINAMGPGDPQPISTTTKTKVYTKYFTGTTDADGTTNIAHGVADVDKILHLSSAIYQSGYTAYLVYDYRYSAAANDAYTLAWQGANNIILSGVGVNLQGKKYRIRMDYYL